jgi:CRP-like cAMP-binding protein
VTIETITDHEVIGWSWLFPPYRWTLTARALCPTRYLVFDAQQVRSLCAHNPTLSYQLMKRTAMTIAQRLLAARLSLINNLA